MFALDPQIIGNAVSTQDTCQQLQTLTLQQHAHRRPGNVPVVLNRYEFSHV